MDKKIPFTINQKIIEFLTAVALLLLFGYFIINWPSIPEKVPSHFNAFGVADDWSGRGSILFIPIVCFALYSVLTIVSFFPAILYCYE